MQWKMLLNTVRAIFIHLKFDSRKWWWVDADLHIQMQHVLGNLLANDQSIDDLFHIQTH